MTEHLPECDTQYNGLLPCICEALRACEERGWDEAYAAGFNHGRAHGELLSCPISHKHGYEQGVQDAREAVAALDACPECAVDDALAAIDALLEERA